MKLILLLAVLFITYFTFAQDCSNYYFLQNNKTIEMTIYGKKGDVAGKQVYKVSDVSKSGSATTAHLNSEMFNKNGKSMAKSSSTIRCEGGVMMIDMKMSMPQQQQSAQGETDVKAENVYIEYPNNMKAGDKLKDATMDMDMSKGGMNQSMHMEVKDRQVEGQQKVTTPAGTWDTFKISYKANMKIKTMGIGVPMNVEGTEYFAPGFGIVKSESKGGGGTEITSIK